MSGPAAETVVARALEQLVSAGASSADVLLVESESHEVRVRADEIDFVKQARERCLGIRAFLRNGAGASSATTSTSDLGDEAVDRMVSETLALARATAADPFADTIRTVCFGLRHGGFPP